MHRQRRGQGMHVRSQQASLHEVSTTPCRDYPKSTLHAAMLLARAVHRHHRRLTVEWNLHGSTDFIADQPEHSSLPLQ